MSRRAKRPLNSSAVAAADAELYRRHENDPRPNALFDADGNRLPLDPDDPSQAGLRDEWMDLYVANGGELEGEEEEDGSNEIDEPVEECPFELASLTVVVEWTPAAAPVEGATVNIEGPVSMQGTTDDQGIAEFEDIPAGDYDIEVILDSGHALVDAARAHIGSTDWAYATTRNPYPAGANKCNLFVYEVADGAGYSVPIRTRWSWSRMSEVWYPPLAGHWADSSETIGNWTMVTDPLPGDVIAEAINYSDATGHVGIISYPESNGECIYLPGGETTTTTIVLERLTVSAGGNAVLENDWGWRSGQSPMFRRYTP